MSIELDLEVNLKKNVPPTVEGCLYQFSQGRASWYKKITFLVIWNNDVLRNIHLKVRLSRYIDMEVYQREMGISYVGNSDSIN